MSVKTAIILAGGFGTRLKEAVPDLPKCLAPVAGRPFLFYVINSLRSQGIDKFIFSLGYKHELIEEYLDRQFSTLNYETTVETEPLGTGGAILFALQKAQDENVLIANGDTLFKVDLSSLFKLHEQMKADATLALKPMKKFDRYGTVELEIDGAIRSFHEKQYREEGTINGGLYLLRRENFLNHNWPAKFSFEKAYLESNKFRIYGDVQEGYFIDIGIPADYLKAQRDLHLPPLTLAEIDRTWTLFIDRDGVINHEIKDDYVRNWETFKFYDGVLDAFAKLNEKAGHIIIVSNQRGVGKGLMTEQDLKHIHQNMLEEIERKGGRIDRIYYCISTDPLHPERKPNPGIAFRAKEEIPGVVLSKSIIVGNKPSDMLFGRNAGMYTVFIKSTNPDQEYPHSDIDMTFNTLAEFAKAL